MIDLEDLLDELYTFDNSCWHESVFNVLNILSFPISFEYVCQWEEFLYVRSNKNRMVSPNDKMDLAKCKAIASYSLGKRFRHIKLFAVYIEESVKTRNDTVYEITKLFRKLYGRFTILVFVNADEMAFSGTAINYNRKTEVILSEWFGYYKDSKINEEMLQVDFSLFSGRSLNEVYNNYLWAIARPYVKYRESKMYLIFEYGNPVTYEVFVPNQEGDGTTLAIRVDREETFRINSEYYPEIYGDDYYIDDDNVEVESLDLLEDEDDIEYEWTMLEMELAAEAEEETDEDYFDDEDGDDSFDIDYDEELIGMNPEEMLNYIRGE